MSEPVVGVIGGMGPEATVELMRRVMAATPAVDDADHIHMIVDNNPKVPSRIAALIEGSGESPAPVIAAMARRLERAGADFLVIPCNTAHHYWSAAAEAVAVPVWHMAELTLMRIASEMGHPGRLGLLGSPALRQIRLYEPFCAARGFSLLYPERQNDLLEVIRAVKAGRIAAHELRILNEVARELVDSGAHALVLGCTEFSVIANRLDADLPVFDTLQVLAEEIVSHVKDIASADHSRRSPHMK